MKDRDGGGVEQWEGITKISIFDILSETRHSVFEIRTFQEEETVEITNLIEELEDKEISLKVRTKLKELEKRGEK